MVTSAFGISSSLNKSLKDGNTSISRISTGSTVHATSISVLWVVFDGTGLALALNLTITMISSASTNKVMTVVITTRKLWNRWMSSITGDAESWRLMFQ